MRYDKYLRKIFQTVLKGLAHPERKHQRSQHNIKVKIVVIIKHRSLEACKCGAYESAF